MDELLKLLAGAGDVGTWVLVLVWWRFDKRLSRLEWITGQHE